MIICKKFETEIECLWSSCYKLLTLWTNYYYLPKWSYKDDSWLLMSECIHEVQYSEQWISCGLKDEPVWRWTP